MEGGSPGSPDGVNMTETEFQQFFERDVAFYSCCTDDQKNQNEWSTLGKEDHVLFDHESEHTIGEIYLLQTSKDAKYQLKTNDVLPFDDSKISCPYCIKLIEKAEKMFFDKPSDKQKELAGVCSHCRRLAKRKKPFHLSTDSGKGLAALHYLRSQVLDADKKDRQTKGEHLKKEQIFPRTLERQSIQESGEEQGKKQKTKGKRHEHTTEKDKKDYNKAEKLKSQSQKQQESGREIDQKSKGPLTYKEYILATKKDGKQSKSKGPLTAKENILATKNDRKQSKTKVPLTVKDGNILAATGDGKRSKSKEKDETLSAKDDKTGKSKEKAEKHKVKPIPTKLLLARATQEKRKKREEEKMKKELEKITKEIERVEKKRAMEAELILKRFMLSERSTSRIVPYDSEESILKQRAAPKDPIVEEIIVGDRVYKITHAKSYTKHASEEIGVDETEESPNNKSKTTDRASTVKSEQLGDKTKPSNKGSIVETGAAGKTRHEPGQAALDTINEKFQKDGVMRFTLSDPTFIDKGWTMLPLEKVVRKINVYRMRPAKPEFDWFEHNKGKVLQYSSGEKLAAIDHSGRGRVYYRKGDLALDYYDAEETNAGSRFVVYSTGTRDENGRPRPKTVLATFDHCGNGIVYDHSGKTRLKYNQTEGVVLDQKLGAVGNWKWHTLNDPPLLQQVMIDTQLEHKIPKIFKMDSEANPEKSDTAMLAIELDNLTKEKLKKMHVPFKPFQIKMKAMKINENFSLKVVDQKTIYLLFRDGTSNMKINIGMEIDTQEIVDTDISEIGDVSNKMDVLPACTASIAELQKQVAQARAGEDRRAARARAWHLPKASVDALYSGTSRALRTPVVTCSVCASKPSIASCGCCNSIS